MDSRSRSHVSIMVSRNGNMHALTTVSMERLLASLIIKLKLLASVHTLRTAVLRYVRWPGY